MIKSRIFLRFAFLGIVISGIFLMLSIFTTQWMRDLIFGEPFIDRGPFRAFEIVIDQTPPDDRVEILKNLRGGRGLLRKPPHPPPRMPPRGPGDGPEPVLELILADHTGRIHFPENLPPETSEALSNLVLKLATSEDDRLLEDDYVVRRLSGEPVQYLARNTHFRPPPPKMRHMFILTAIQMASIVAAVLVTLGLVFYYLRNRGAQADVVMRELARGNLKARIPITKMDEVGQFMSAFNKMADEIEHLIEHLRKTENSRRDLLRELAHDLRTPVASLKSLIETVTERSDQLPKEKLRELLELAMNEAQYFEGLVDDLLFLGRVGEPKYKTSLENFDLADLIRLELEAISARYPKIGVEFKIAGGDSETGTFNYDGDPNLMKRLIRNTLENAASFAKSAVVIELNRPTVGDSAIQLNVRDDGPGFDAASLASFGQRKYSRAMTNVGGSRRISIGLGSVIMKSITDVHRGDLVASNAFSPTGDILGAEVSIRLPSQT